MCRSSGLQHNLGVFQAEAESALQNGRKPQEQLVNVQAHMESQVFVLTSATAACVHSTRSSLCFGCCRQHVALARCCACPGFGPNGTTGAPSCKQLGYAASTAVGCCCRVCSHTGVCRMYLGPFPILVMYTEWHCVCRVSLKAQSPSCAALWTTADNSGWLPYSPTRLCKRLCMSKPGSLSPSHFRACVSISSSCRGNI